MTDRLHEQFDVAGLSDVGRKRRLNEDSFGIDRELGLLVVADGMGGHDKGEVASGLAVATITDFLYEYDPDSAFDGDDAANASDETVSRAARDLELAAGHRHQIRAVHAAVKMANTRIFDENRAQGYNEGAGMGTTVVGLWLLDPDDHAAIFHVGDSRLYRFRDGRLSPITRDHTLYQDWLDNGGAGEPPRRNIILRALGPWPEVEVEVQVHPVMAGDIFVICSDGMSGMVTDEEMEKALRGSAGGDLDAACRHLIEMANEAGGNDNITVILARRR